MWLLCIAIRFHFWSIMNFWKEYGHSQAEESCTNDMPDGEAPEAPWTQGKATAHLLFPLGNSSCRGRTTPVVRVNFTSRRWPLPSLWRGNEWHSPAAPGGNRRLGACGSAYGQKGRPRRGWCIYLVLTLTLHVWPRGLPGPLGTQDGEPSGRTGGSIAGDYKREKKDGGRAAAGMVVKVTQALIVKVRQSFLTGLHVLCFWGEIRLCTIVECLKYHKKVRYDSFTCWNMQLLKMLFGDMVP